MVPATAEVNFPNEGTAEVQIFGELDVTTAEQLDTVLDLIQNEGSKKVFIDCEQLKYISSPGIGVFTSRISDWKTNQISVVLFNVQANVANVFKILGIDRLLKIAPNREQAEEILNAN
jgi:anti-sigma B factor antagonist